MATGIAPFLTRAPAVCLVAIMGGAAATHMMRELATVNGPCRVGDGRDCVPVNVVLWSSARGAGK